GRARRRAREARQRLEAQYVAAREIHDRLIDHAEPIAAEHRLDAASALRVALDVEAVALDEGGGDVREGSHDLDVALVQTVVGRATEAAKSAVDAAIAQVQWNAQVRADREPARSRQLERRRQFLCVANELG